VGLILCMSDSQVVVVDNNDGAHIGTQVMENIS